MRIGLYLCPTDRSGGSRYLWGLCAALGRVGRQHDYVLYLDRGATVLGDLRQLPFPRRYVGTTGSSRVHRQLPAQLRRDGIEVLHTHVVRMPLQAPCKVLVTVHDTIPVLSSRGTVAPRLRQLFADQFTLALRAADHLIASSRYTQRQLIDHLGVVPRRVTTIYPGAPEGFRPVPPGVDRQIRRRFRLTRPYLLTVGALIPRKNHRLLICAFRRRLARTHDLVIVGSSAWGAAPILRMIHGDRTIRYLGGVDDWTLQGLYAGADCCVYPSEEEGFGFPPLEAMACGTPVVALRGTSLPEVVGRAGLLVPPGSMSRLADALERVLSQPALRAQLCRRGVARLRHFSWDDTAAKTLRVYQRVLSERAGTR